MDLLFFCPLNWLCFCVISLLSDRSTEQPQRIVLSGRLCLLKPASRRVASRRLSGAAAMAVGDALPPPRLGFSLARDLDVYEN
uniref:Secreted protein n=1 Tax=Arundo donax TaxID=35708 RepID=A0A0A9G4B6_ARUDO